MGPVRSGLPWLLIGEGELVDPAIAMPMQGRGEFRVGDVFAKAFQILGRHFVALLILALLSNIPVFLYLLAYVEGVGGNAETMSGIAPLLGMIGDITASGAITYGVVQRLRHQDFTVGRSLEIGLSCLFPILGVSILTFLAVALGLVLLIIPGLMLSCMYYVAGPVCVVERPGVVASLSRSSALTKGCRWKIFGIVVVVILASIAMQQVAPAVFGAEAHVALLAGYLLDMVVSAFGAVLSGVTYYQLRVAKEGVDIETIARVFD